MIRIEFLYDNIKEITQIFIWDGSQIIDKMEIPEKLNHNIRKEMKKELLEKYQDE